MLAGESTVGSNTVGALARYNTDGTLDAGFDTDGILTTSDQRAGHDSNDRHSV